VVISYFPEAAMGGVCHRSGLNVLHRRMTILPDHLAAGNLASAG
jgi:hypothetical protein